MWRRIGPYCLRYGVALLAVAVALSLKLVLQKVLDREGPSSGVEREAPFMLSLAAVMISGWYGGLGPGLMATGLTAAIGDFFFMKPFNQFGLYSTAQKIRAALFVMEGVVVSVLCESLNLARRRAERNETETRGLQRELLDITDSEQRRIGHDLHDGLGQHLTGIAFMSKLIEQRLAARKVPEAEDARKIAGLVNNAIGWTRDLARGLAPVDLDQEEGLSSALKRLAEGTSEMFGTDCRFEALGEVRVKNPSAAIHLYRIAQEALNNAVKHGQPRRIWVRLIGVEGKVVISVEDDGRGFDPEHVRKGGMGLRIMHYRAKMVSGKLDVRRRDAGGIIVTCIYHRREQDQKDVAHAPHNEAGGIASHQSPSVAGG